MTGVSPGTATITASAADGSGASASIDISVYRPVTKITLDRVSGYLIKTKKLTLAATIEPGDATYRTLQWSTSDARVATVSGNGVVTAVGIGTTIITARTEYGATGKEKADFALTVAPAVASISLSADRTVIKAGDALAVAAKVLPAGAANPLAWSSDNAKVATVSNAGVVNRRRPGQGDHHRDGGGRKRQKSEHQDRRLPAGRQDHLEQDLRFSGEEEEADLDG